MLSTARAQRPRARRADDGCLLPQWMLGRRRVRFCPRTWRESGRRSAETAEEHTCGRGGSSCLD
jgi:hypothetical protein